MEGGIKTGHLRHSRQQAAKRVKTGERTRQMERRKVDECLQAAAHFVVNHYRVDKLAAPVDDAMADCVNRPKATNCVGEFAIIDTAIRSQEFLAIEQPLTVAEH
jgi:hypothetical protein